MSATKEFVVAKIVIQRIMDDDGADTIWVEAEDESGEPLALVTALGMLRMTEDTLFRLDREDDTLEEYEDEDDEEDEAEEDSEEEEEDA